MSTLNVDTLQDKAGAFEHARLVQIVKTSLSTKSTGTTAVVADTTPMLITEGDQYMTLEITPTHADNILYVSANIPMFGSGNATDIAHSLFNTDIHSTNALATTDFYLANHSNACGTAHLTYDCLASDANGTSATTFRMRAGGVAGTYTICGYANSAQYSTGSRCTMYVMEVRA